MEVVDEDRYRSCCGRSGEFSRRVCSRRRTPVSVGEACRDRGFGLARGIVEWFYVR